MSFTSLGLCEPILKAIKDQGYDTPTPIQKQAIPIVLDKKDVLAGAQTGTGKTAAFTLPLLQRLHNRPKQLRKKEVRALILSPTRELAAQIAQNVSDYGKYLPFTSMVIFGGVGINPQITKLKKGIDIVIATPGRLLDLVQQGAIDLTQIEYFVLDEADRMLDMGFIHDIKRIIKLIPRKRQNLLLSATFSEEIKKLASNFLVDPSYVEVARQNTSAQTIKQKVYLVDKKRKHELLRHLIQKNSWKQVLVFTRTKHGANKLTEHLKSKDITAAAIHGNKSQSARTKALSDFKKGAIRILVATDIAARGIDIDDLPHVVNYELPNIAEDYVHRIGRTGRAGKNGEAISLVCIDEKAFLIGIEKLINKKIDSDTIDGFEPNPAIKAEPIQKRQQGNNRKNYNNSGKAKQNIRSGNNKRDSSRLRKSGHL